MVRSANKQTAVKGPVNAGFVCMGKLHFKLHLPRMVDRLEGMSNDPALPVVSGAHRASMGSADIVVSLFALVWSLW